MNLPYFPLIAAIKQQQQIELQHKILISSKIDIFISNPNDIGGLHRINNYLVEVVQLSESNKNILNCFYN